MRWVAAVLSMLVLAAAGCGKGGNDDIDNPFAPEVIQGAADARLGPAAGPQTAAVSGRLSITGFTVLDEEGLPVMDGQGAPKAMARLLDPGDDILHEVFPGLDGRFQLMTTAPVTAGIVEISFRVEEDLDGDGTGGDTIAQRLPVALLPGRVVTLELELAKGEAAEIDAGLPVAAPGETGEFMLTHYLALDANGSHESFYGTFFARDAVVYDMDGDEFLEIGDDQSGDDENSNGWVDTSEDQFLGAVGGVATLEGVITSVSKADQQFTIRHADGSTSTIDLLAFTSLEVFGPDGLFVGQTSLGDHLVGMQAYIEGSTTSGGTFAASWVVVHD